jgi:predicted transcriptional regulator
MRVQKQYLLALSARIVAAHTGHNLVEEGALPSMIRNVFKTLSALEPLPQAATDLSSVAHDGHDHENYGLDEQISGHTHNLYVHPQYGQTLFGDHLICMEDGLSMKMLKRHLLTVHGITPGEYRAKWGLPESYPMVAADYARLRSTLARESGLGLKPDDRVSKARRKSRGS